jgi:hypothetical protein
LPLDEALAKLGKRLGLRVRGVILPYANAAIDVDSIADLQLVDDYFASGEADEDQSRARSIERRPRVVNSPDVLS